MNAYIKFCPSVFLAKCTEKHEKGTIIEVTTKYGKENECIVFNLIYEKEGFFFYSIVRADGFNAQQIAQTIASCASAIYISMQLLHFIAKEIANWRKPKPPNK